MQLCLWSEMQFFKVGIFLALDFLKLKYIFFLYKQYKQCSLVGKT